MENDRYTIDPDMSRFSVRAFASGMLSALGHNPRIAIRNFSGEAEFPPGSPEKGSLRIQVDAASLSVTDNVSDKDRREMEQAMNRDVLEVARYPEIIFDSSAVSASPAGDGHYNVNLAGKLSLHGVTNDQPVVAQVTIGDSMLTARGEFSIKQTAYGIKLVSVAGGALKVKDELKFSFDIVARKQFNHN